LFDEQTAPTSRSSRICLCPVWHVLCGAQHVLRRVLYVPVLYVSPKAAWEADCVCWAWVPPLGDVDRKDKPLHNLVLRGAQLAFRHIVRYVLRHVLRNL